MTEKELAVTNFVLYEYKKNTSYFMDFYEVGRCVKGIFGIGRRHA